MNIRRSILASLILLGLPSCLPLALGGSVAGAAAGAALGRQSGNIAAGAIIGVASGAALGAAIGSAIEEQRRVDEEVDPMLTRQDIEKRRQAREIEDLKRQIYHDNALRHYLRDRRDPDYEEVYGDSADL